MSGMIIMIIKSYLLADIGACSQPDAASCAAFISFPPHGLEPYTSAECYLKSAAKMRYLARKSTVVNAATSVLSS